MASKRVDDEYSPKPPAKRMRSADGSSKASSATPSPKRVASKAAPKITKGTKVSANGVTKKKAPAKKATGTKPKSPAKKPASKTAAAKGGAAKGKKKADIDTDADADTAEEEEDPDTTVTKAKAKAKPGAKPGGRPKKAAAKGKKAVPAKKKEEDVWKPTLCSTGLDAGQVDMLEQITQKKKSKLLVEYDARVTHMVVNSYESDETPKRTMKLCKAIAGGQSIVCFKWISDSIGVSSIWKDVREYLHPLTRDAKTTPKLFADMEFYFGALGTFNNQKADLAEIVRLGGGKVLSKKPEEPPPTDLSQESEDTEPPTSKIMLVEQTPENDKQRSARRASLAALCKTIPGAQLIAPGWILDECCAATRKEGDKKKKTDNDNDDEMEGDTKDKIDDDDDGEADLDEAKKEKAMEADEDDETEEDVPLTEMKKKMSKLKKPAKKKEVKKKPPTKKAATKKKTPPKTKASPKKKGLLKKKVVEEKMEEEEKKEEENEVVKETEEKEAVQEEEAKEPEVQEGEEMKDVEEKKEDEEKKVLVEPTAEDDSGSDL